MAAPKNHAKAGGRKKGEPNKMTQDLRESIRLFLELEYEHLNDVLEDLRTNNKVAYVNAIEKFTAYVVPKKRDITSDDKPISIPQPINITVDSSETAETLKKLRDGASID